MSRAYRAAGTTGAHIDRAKGSDRAHAAAPPPSVAGSWSAQIPRGGRLAWAVVAIAVAGCRFGRLPAPAAPRPAERASPPAASERGTPAALPKGVTREEYDYLASRRILIPVANARLARIADSFDHARDGRRVHAAVDIMAPRGTPVIAADDGRVLRMRRGGAGGITLYALEPRERFVYYYAHLERYRKGLAEGDRLRKGDTVGFVGTSGNAPRDVPHLHFQIMRMPADGRWWAGIPVNPRPLFAR